MRATPHGVAPTVDRVQQLLRALGRESNNIPLEQAILISDIGEHNSALVGASITGCQLVLMEQAEAILARYPEDATALDYFVLGEANSRATNYATAERNYQKALELPLTPQTDLALHRGIALASFGLGQPARGRESYQLALDFDTRHDEVTDLFDEWSAITTRLFWVSAEVVNGRFCPEAGEQLELLDEAAASSSNQSLYNRPMGLQIEATIAAYRQFCPEHAAEVSRLSELAAVSVISVEDPLADVATAGG